MFFHLGFCIAAVPKPTIGADFLRYFSLLVDMKHHLLIDTTIQLWVQGIVSSDTSPMSSITRMKSDNPFFSLLSEFPTLTQVYSLDRKVKHEVTHHINTKGSPVAARPLCLILDHLSVPRD